MFAAPWNEQSQDTLPVSHLEKENVAGFEWLLDPSPGRPGFVPG